MNTQPHSPMLLICWYTNLGSTTLQEEVRPDFALVDPVEVPVVAEEGTVSFLPNKVEETEETGKKDPHSPARTETTAKKSWQGRMVKRTRASLVSDARSWDIIVTSVHMLLAMTYKPCT